MTNILKKCVVFTTAFALISSTSVIVDIKKRNTIHIEKTQKRKLSRLNPRKIITKPLVYIGKGIASFYGINDGFQGKRTASGIRFNTFTRSCAMLNVKLGTLVHIKNIDNGLTTTCKILDRGPYITGRIIDLSYISKQDIRMNSLARVIIW
jgi:rare lipoprotein A (peptidoglycan hydrolase)